MGKKVGFEDDDADSWDDHNFTEDAADWRDTSDKEGKETTDDSERGEQSDQEDANSDDEQDNSDEKDSELKTSHAKKSAKLEEQTTALEKELLAEKPWQMTGEAKSTKRPVNSLLESTPEFAVASKIAPTITVEHTSNIEDMIKQRIIAEDWDDVIPRELPDIGRKRDDDLPEVSQEKSKLGLGELYEREYLKKALNYDKNAAEKETSEEKVQSEMKALFASLCSRLDALSNYHFAPRPVADEAEVRTVTTPAIAMEEVLPLHVSDARGVAPEEVYGAKKGRESVLKGESEFDQVRKQQFFVWHYFSFPFPSLFIYLLHNIIPHFCLIY
jgi:U3 small nucleolar RNA-associated protein MPP10